MTFTETNLKGSYLIKPNVLKDARGYFFESFRTSDFSGSKMNYEFIQDNESKSQKGVLRGLHYQIGEHAQAKLVRVIQGSVLDVAVDLRPNSETFGQHFKAILSGDNKMQFLIPRGFAHGFLVLEDDTVFAYKCDNFYNKASERGIRFDDPSLNIDWGVPKEDLILSEKDTLLPLLKDAEIRYE
jgi:dTDP-4-dehydrorhamnose 3,5-epimerase